MGKKSFRTRKPVITGDALNAIEGQEEDVLTKEEEKKAPVKTETKTAAQPGKDEGSTPKVQKEEKVEKDSKPKKKRPEIEDNAILRKTFLINAKKFDKLMDFIYTKKVHGQFRYTQEVALEEALDLLFTTEKKILTRPEEERKLERERSKRIRESRA